MKDTSKTVANISLIQLAITAILVLITFIIKPQNSDQLQTICATLTLSSVIIMAISLVLKFIQEKGTVKSNNN